jgi:hypothetical protein
MGFAFDLARGEGRPIGPSGGTEEGNEPLPSRHVSKDDLQASRGAEGRGWPATGVASG